MGTFDEAHCDILQDIGYESGCGPDHFSEKGAGLRYLSLFSGIEACTVAWAPLGMKAVAFAQYEPGDKVQFPSKVLEYHYPDVPNLGDVTQITEEQIKALGHIDLVVGGSPCQDLSVAGKRAGLRNEDGSVTRSGLFDYQMQIFEWAREHCGARFMLWENVPGALSSGKEVKGSDFAYILGSMVGRDVEVPAGGWRNSGIVTSGDGKRIVEYRILDAQYFGVAQRRRRLFALADVGAWWCRPPVLFEPEGVPGDSEKGKGTREGSSSTSSEDAGGDGEPGPSSGTGGRLDAVAMDKGGTIRAASGGTQGTSVGAR